MKKKDKMFLGIGSISIGVGVILGMIGWGTGGISYAADAYDYVMEEKVEAITGTGTSYSVENSTEFIDEMEITDENVEISVEDKLQEITSIDFDIPYGKLTISTGDSYWYRISNIKEESYTSEVKNGVWKIEGKDKNFSLGDFEFFGMGIGINTEPIIEITIPENAVFDTVKLSVGVGTMYAENNINTKELELSVGAGEMTVEHLTVTQKSNIETGTGSIYLENVNLINTMLDCGVGSIYLNGSIKGENKINCGIGNITMELEERFKDCYYSVDCGLGSVIINGRTYHDDDKIGKKDAASKFKLDCGVGNIDIITSDY